MPKRRGFVVDGKKVDQWSIDPDIETDSCFDTKAGVIRTFSDRKAFVNWAKDAGIAENIQDTIKKLEEIKARHEAIRISDRQQAALESQQTTEFATKQRAVDALLRKQRVSPENYGGLLKLHKAGKLGSMIVYDPPGCVGNWAYFPPGLYPKLSWFGWNDRISSLYNLGLLASLHQHTWFRGHRLWVTIFAGYKDLGWWNNRISSMVFYS